MSNRIDLRVSRSLELLERLRKVVSSFAAQERALVSEISRGRSAAQRKHHAALGEIEAKLASELERAESYYAGEKERLQARDSSRRERIQRACRAVDIDSQKSAQRAKEGWLNQLQMRHFQAARELPINAEAAREKLVAFYTELTEERRRLQRLGRRRSPSQVAGTEIALQSEDHLLLLENLREQLQRAEETKEQLRRMPLGRIFRFGRAGQLRATLIQLIEEANRLSDACESVARQNYEHEVAEMQADYDRLCAYVDEQWSHGAKIERDFAEMKRKKLAAQAPRVLARGRKVLASRLAALDQRRTAHLAAIQEEASASRQRAVEAHESGVQSLSETETARWGKLQEEWAREITPLYQAIGAMNIASEQCTPTWESLAKDWEAPREFPAAVRFGYLEAELSAFAEALPQDSRLVLPGASHLSLPLSLSFPEEASLLFESAGARHVGASKTFNTLILRILAATPPGKASFTIIDPVGLGQDFAGLMHLTDYEENLIGRRIWTQRDQIEDRLAELNEHIEKVIQMYLRNEYATIADYNAQAGSVAEKYHFLVISGFPAGFSEVAATRLQSILRSGPRCGVFTLIEWDAQRPLPDAFSTEGLRDGAICIRREGDAFVLCQAGARNPGVELVLDEPPSPDLAIEIVHRIGERSVDSSRVEVPFASIAPAPEEFWSGVTTNELRVPIGRTGATKLQHLAIGKGTRQHALFVGKTGSGKSTLFHVIITNLALMCSPEQVEFYLIDFKKGVEFKCYAEQRLPHARVVAIESDREFALSVLHRLDEELKRRGDIFRALGVQDLAGYKRAGGAEPMPRSLLIIDEFQEFFVEDDAIAQTASMLFDRLVRQGRAFGIHVLLGSQTLGGAYTLTRTTMGQMVIRVALMCNEADAYLIMDENNSAPRLLSRPGEGIYNDSAGASEGNSPFQVVWLPDDERDTWLAKVRAFAARQEKRFPAPVVFEGNAPADIRENELLAKALESTTVAAVPPRAWLGAPNSIKGPTAAVFHRQSGNHLLIVGQRDEAALTMLGFSLISLSAQFPPGGAHFVFIHAAAPGSSDAELLDRFVSAARHPVKLVRGPDIPEAMDELAAELKSRESAVDDPPVFVFIHGLQRFKKLRHEDEFSFSSSDETSASSGAQFQSLITEGSSHGIHLLVSIDTFNNVNRALTRKALSEFEMRVLFQMSANDSASLIDSPKASNLGLHRALFYSESEGTVEVFRPYAPPPEGWLDQPAEKPIAPATAVKAATLSGPAPESV